ncbi:MAG: dicarboxylate transporter-DctP subunit [Rhodoglobus sp.]|nr:dicarboxylate transporter-DctP subunit [Rhodoglobus sp.]
MFVLLAAAAMALSGCSTPGPAPLVLTMAHVGGDLVVDPAAGWFVDDVAELSGGRLQVRLAGDCCGAGLDAQKNLITQVRARIFDLGWIATTGDLGLANLQALSTPGLIDSYAAEAAVLGSDLGPEVMHGFDVAAMKPIALEPGFLQRPIASNASLVAPSDWAGLGVWSAVSLASAAAVTALGAVSSQIADAGRDAALADGTVTAAIGSTPWQAESRLVPDPVLTANEALWPRISVLFANPNSYKALTPQQLGWIRDAAAATTARTLDLATLDAQAILTVCAQGGHVVLATDAQLAATVTALAPALDALRADPAIASLVDRMQALKPGNVAQEYAVPEGCLY